MSKPFSDFHSAWNWLRRHPRFRDSPKSNVSLSRFGECLDICVTKVDPTTEGIDKNVHRNTATRVWLECGAIERLCEEDGNIRFAPCHNYDLDCGAPTFEEAIQQLADLVLAYYGNYNA